jgi:hypothetical protein
MARVGRVCAPAAVLSRVAAVRGCHRGVLVPHAGVVKVSNIFSPTVDTALILISIQHGIVNIDSHKYEYSHGCENSS